MEARGPRCFGADVQHVCGVCGRGHGDAASKHGRHDKRHCVRCTKCIHAERGPPRNRVCFDNACCGSPLTRSARCGCGCGRGSGFLELHISRSRPRHCSCNRPGRYNHRGSTCWRLTTGRHPTRRCQSHSKYHHHCPNSMGGRRMVAGKAVGVDCNPHTGRRLHGRGGRGSMATVPVLVRTCQLLDRRLAHPPGVAVV